MMKEKFDKMHQYVVDAIKKSPMSQNEISNKSGYGQSMISYVVSGRRRMSIDMMTMIIAVLGLDVDEVFAVAGYTPSVAILHC